MTTEIKAIKASVRRKTGADETGFQHSVVKVTQELGANVIVYLSQICLCSTP